MRNIKDFQEFVFESEATLDQFKNIFNQVALFLRTKAQEIANVHLSYAKSINEAKTDRERTTLRTEMQTKIDAIKKQITANISSNGNLSPFQYDALNSWADTVLDFLLAKEMGNMKDKFSKEGLDTSKWESQYDTTEKKLAMDIQTKSIAKKFSFQVPPIA